MKTSKLQASLREATKAVSAKAPDIVAERILPQILDDVGDYTGEIMRKLTTLDAGGDKAVELAYDIVRDGLLREVASQVSGVSLKEADKRVKKLFGKKK